MHARRLLLTTAVLLAGVALAQTSGTGSQPSGTGNPSLGDLKYPSVNPTPNSTGSTSQPPGTYGTTPTPNLSGPSLTPPSSNALGTTPSPEAILTELHAANQSEVDLGRVAEQRGHDKAVKGYGTHMVKAHTAMDKDLQSWAKKNHVTVGAPPAEAVQETQQLKDRLGQLSGAEFDKAYMQAMAEDHAKDLDKVKTFEQQTGNKSLKSLLGKAEKETASHKKDADKLVQKLGATAAR
jgi:putative membrane protein